MDFTIEDAELDYGTLVIEPGRDNDITLSVTGGTAELRIPLFNHEAKELIEKLTPLAEAPDQ